MDINKYIERLQSFIKRFDWAVILKYVLMALFALVVIVFIFGFFFQSCNDYLFERDMYNRKSNVNSLMENANAVKGGLQNLKVNEAIRETEVNTAKNALINARESTDNAREGTNERLLGVNAVEGKDFSNTSLSNAQKARCLAFPDSKGCS